MMDLVFDLLRLSFAKIKSAGVLGDEVGVAQCRLIPDSDVAGGLVGDMHFVPLFAEADERAAHGNHIVVGMWGEDHDAFGEEGGVGVLESGRDAGRFGLDLVSAIAAAGGL